VTSVSHVDIQNKLQELTFLTKMFSFVLFGLIMFLFHPHCELEQLRKGFRETLQVELLVCLHAKQIHGLLAASCIYDVTPEFFLDEFAINYSDPGSNKRTAEEAVILHWSDFITDCKGKKLFVGFTILCVS